MEFLGFIGGNLGYRLLRRIRPDGDETGTYCDTSAYQSRSKMELLFGRDVWMHVKGNHVLDFGCGMGNEAIEMARNGARKVTGIDSRQRVLEIAKETARIAGLAQICKFTTVTQDTVDVIFSVDGFEHYDKPDEILSLMKRLLVPGGRVLICFGPPWLHPYGGHLFSVFPWAHLIFTEKSLIRWRADFKNDGATRFDEVEGGLNKMTVGLFQKLVQASGFEIEKFESVPIKKLRWFSSPFTREFTTSVVRCMLIRPNN